MCGRKTSITAYIVAVCLMKLAQMPEWKGSLSDDARNLTTAFVMHGRSTLLRYAISCLPPKVLLGIMDRFFIPGMMHHYLFRKLLIEKKLHETLGDGATQVIILGGGFDTLALLMARKYPEIVFFEIDLPDTQQVKLSILKQVHYEIPPNCRYISADLAKTKLETVLKADNSFNTTAPTFVLLEGVLMYLKEPEVKTLFSALHSLFGNTLTILFGATAAPDNAGTRSVRMINALLDKNQEATHWHCASMRMPEFIKELGFELREFMPYRKLQSFYRSEAETCKLPAEDENYYVVAKMPQQNTNKPFVFMDEVSFISVKS